MKNVGTMRGFDAGGSRPRLICGYKSKSFFFLPRLLTRVLVLPSHWHHTALAYKEPWFLPVGDNSASDCALRSSGLAQFIAKMARHSMKPVRLTRFFNPPSRQCSGGVAGHSLFSETAFSPHRRQPAIGMNAAERMELMAAWKDLAPEF